VASASFSLGVMLFARLVEDAARLFGPFADYDPYIVEWHRRTKADRPSGTAIELSRRLIAAHPRKTRVARPMATARPRPKNWTCRSFGPGAAPGMHLVGFDAPGESLEMRLTARDRSPTPPAPHRRRVAAGRAPSSRLPQLRRRRRLDHRQTAGRVQIERPPSGREPEPDLVSLTRPPAACQAAHGQTRPPDEPPQEQRDATQPPVPGSLHGPRDAVHTRRRNRRRTAFRALVRRQIDAGIHGLVACGTTGETPTLSHEEDEWVIATTLEVASERPSRPRVRVIAGTGSNSTATAIRSTRRAAKLGVDAALVVAPYYNKPDQRMLEAHFRAVADEGDLPIIVYNVPGRTGVNVEAATLLRLAEHPRIVAVKEASANMDQIATILRDRPADFSVLAGDDTWTMPMLALGGDGVICTCANEIPGEMAEMCDAAFAGDWEQARLIHERWLPLMKANFAGGPNPVPVKAAMSMMGLCSDTLRMPLMPLDEPHRARLRLILETSGLLEPDNVVDIGCRIRRTDRRSIAPQPRHTRERRRSDGRILADLDAGRVRAAQPDPDAPGGWRVNSAVQQAILGSSRPRDPDLGPRRRDAVPRPRRPAGQEPDRLARGPGRAGRRQAVARRPGRHVGSRRRLSGARA
jgi:4-hydroxy-tetrahydrodipicolinate synthase